MGVDFQNLLVGSADLFVGADENHVIDVGATSGGVEVSWEVQMQEVESDREANAVQIIQKSTKVWIATKLSEITLANIGLAWNIPIQSLDIGGTSTTVTWDNLSGFTWAQLAPYIWENISITGSGGSTSPGSIGTVHLVSPNIYPDLHFVKIVGPGPHGTTRTYKCWTCVSYEASTINMARDKAEELTVKFRVLPDRNHPGQEYGIIIDA